MFEQFHYLWILVNLIMSISSQSTSFCYFWHFYPKLFRILLHLSIMQTFPHRRIYQPDAISINGPRFDIVEIRSRYCRNEGTSWAEKHKHTPIHTHTPSHTPSHTHTHIFTEMRAVESVWYSRHVQVSRQLDFMEIVTRKSLSFRTEPKEGLTFQNHWSRRSSRYLFSRLFSRHWAQTFWIIFIFFCRREKNCFVSTASSKAGKTWMAR